MWIIEYSSWREARKDSRLRGELKVGALCVLCVSVAVRSVLVVSPELRCGAKWEVYQQRGLCPTGCISAIVLILPFLVSSPFLLSIYMCVCVHICEHGYICVEIRGHFHTASSVTPVLIFRHKVSLNLELSGCVKVAGPANPSLLSIRVTGAASGFFMWGLGVWT